MTASSAGSASHARQSPIHIQGWASSNAPAPDFAYASHASGVERPQGLPIITFERGSDLSLGSDRYRLLQLHWHTPAEHMIGGEAFAAELHLVHDRVHTSEEGQLLVVGALYRVGKADNGVQRLIDATPPAGTEAAPMPTLSAADYAPPAAAGFYHYCGSLTAPPYSEPVLWYVSMAIGTISQQQFQHLQALTNGPNARPLQDLNGRTISCVGCQR